MSIKLQLITQEVEHKTHDLIALEACRGGITWVQLRDKKKSVEELTDLAIRIKESCHRFGITLIVNDSVEAAKASKAHGVHLGMEDMDPIEARKILGGQAIIGGTANTYEDVVYLSSRGVDYIGLGPFRFTATKAILGPILGADGIQNVIEQARKNGIKTPIFAAGGIGLNDIAPLLETGVKGVALSSRICASHDIESAARSFLGELGKCTLL